MSYWAEQGAEPLSADGYRCSRCDVECERWRWDADHSMGEWYACPCCRSRIRSPEQMVAAGEAEAARQGITFDEWRGQMRAKAQEIIDPSPLSAEALAGMQEFARRSEQEWTPACEHDTRNPWAAE